MDDTLEQIIERVPHTLTELPELTRENKCWTYIKSHARARNGRAVYMAFKELSWTQQHWQYGCNSRAQVDQ